ncbi:MAG: NAD(P)/FAD-dependent oxidoreductase [Thermoplasmata archaeon]
MKIQIYGAGMAGCYLAHLLGDEYNFQIYDVRDEPDCRCAWGWANFSTVREYCRKIDVNADGYVLTTPKRAVINGIEFKVKNVVIFDKINFLKDLWQDLDVKKPEKLDADLVVDATGEKRAIFGDDDVVYYLRTFQAKTKSNLDEDCIYIYAKKFGYAWAFPLGKRRWHIGVGAFTHKQVIDLLNNFCLFYHVKMDGDCKCTSKILYDPYVSKVRRFDNTYLVAVGEAGGFISGFGEGNTLALETSYELYDSLKKASSLNEACEMYERNVVKKVEWIFKQHDFVHTLNRSWVKALFKLPTIYKIASVRSIEGSKLSMLKLLWRLRK